MFLSHETSRLYNLTLKNTFQIRKLAPISHKVQLVEQLYRYPFNGKKKGYKYSNSDSVYYGILP